MVFDAAADVTAQQALATAHPEPDGHAGQALAAEPKWSHLAEALKAVPVTPNEKSTGNQASPGRDDAEGATGNARGGDVLARMLAANVVSDSAAAADEVSGHLEQGKAAETHLLDVDNVTNRVADGRDATGDILGNTNRSWTVEAGRPSRLAEPIADNHSPVASDRVIHEPRPRDTGDLDTSTGGGKNDTVPKEIFFVWDNVKNWRQLVADLGDAADVHVLSSNKDGVAQIADILKDQSNISAIHLISHGEEGSLNLGTAVLDAESMQGQYLDDLTAIGQAMTRDGDILIYGCDFAAGADGLRAAVALGGITGADIAASTDLTGAAILGGDWDLERQTGTIETASFADAGYAALLAPPIDGDEVNSVVEDTTLAVLDGATGDLLDNAIDLDGDPLTIASYTIPGVNGGNPITAGTATLIAGVGTITINADGSYEFAPVANYDGAIPIITYTVSDGTGATNDSTLTLSMVAVNDAPDAVDDSDAIAEDTTATGNVLTNDTDIEGDTLVVTGFEVDGTSYTAGQTATLVGIGTLMIDTDGTYTFTPDADYDGAVPVATYTVSDGNLTSTATLSITITGVNDPPVAVDDSDTIAEDATATGNVLDNDTDADGDSPTVTQFVVDGTIYTAGDTATLAGIGTLLINGDGSYVFTPEADYNGPVPVATYTMSDGSQTSTATLTVSVTAINDAPMDGDETNDVNEDTTLTVADGTSGDLLDNATDIDGGTLEISGFSIAGEGGPFVIGSPYTIAGVGDITINADGSYAFVPASNYVGGIPVITYTVSDGVGGTDMSTLTLTIVAANDAPEGADNTVTIDEDTAHTFTAGDFGFTDPDDVSADALQAVIITTLPSATEGTLFLNGIAVTAGQAIALADIGGLTFEPAADFNGSDVGAFTFQVVDDGGTANGGEDTDQSPNAFSFNITAVNDPPVAIDDVATTPEETTLSGNVLTNDIDVDGDTLSVTQFAVGSVTASAGQTGTIPGVGDLTINADGSYTFVPVANFTGSVQVITYTMIDGNGHTTTATLTIEVTPVNDPPVDGNETNTVTEDTTLTVADGSSGDLVNNASDLDGDTLEITDFTVAGEAGPFVVGTGYLIAGVGTITVNANGSYSFVPVADYDGAIPVITYTVSDGAGGTDTSTLTLSITPVNDAPIAQDDSDSTPENTPVSGNVLTNDSDVDNPTLTVTFFEIDGTTYGAGTTATLSGVGTLVINADGSYVFTPAPSYNGPVPSATYTVSDGALTDTAILTLSITPLNDPPVADDETATTAEDTTLTVPASSGLLAGDTDVDGDTLTITQFEIDGTTYAVGDTATISGVGTLTINADGSYVFVPAANYNGPVPSVTYTVSDGNGGADQGTLTIDVTPVNDTPDVVDDSDTTPEDTTLNGDVLANDTDVEGDPLVVVGFQVVGIPGSYIAGSTATIPGVGTITVNADGTYVLVPAPNYTGPVPTVTYLVSEGNGGTESGTLTLVVTPVNDPPVANDDAATTPVDTTLNGDVLDNDTDVDGDPLDITGFQVDGDPTVYGPGDTATIAGVGDLTLNADGSYTFVPEPGYTGSVPDVAYTVSDGADSDDGVLSIDVLPPNAVGANNDVATTPEDTDLTGNVLANDVDPNGDPLSVVSFTIAGDPTVYTAGDTATIAGVGDLTLNADGSYTFAPAPDYNGPVPVVTYTATDGPLSDMATLTITVTPVNDVPVAVDDTGTTPEDTTLTGNVLTNDTDVDGNTLSVTGFVVLGINFASGQTANIPSVGQLTINADGSYTFVPFADYNGPVPSVTYTVSDGSGGADTGALDITVTPVNDPPVAVDDTATTPEDTTLNGNVLTNDTDVDADTLSVTQFVVDGTTYMAGDTATISGVGALTINTDGSYEFVPSANYHGPVPSVTYMVSDSNGGTDSGTLDISVTSVNDPPVAIDNTATVAEDSTLTVPAGSGLLSDDTDIDGDTLTVTQFVVGGIVFGPGTPATIPGVGVLTINADGSYTFTPSANYNGPVPLVTYTVSDGHGGTDTATLEITVTPVNDAPVAVDDSGTTAEETPLSGDVLTNDTDIDGDTLSVSQFVVDGVTYAAGDTATIAGVGELTINADGSYTFVPALDYTGPVPDVTYTASDSNGGSDTGTLTLDVTPINDPPVPVNDTATTAEDTTLTVAAPGLLLNDVDVDGDMLTIDRFSIAGISGSFLGGATATIPGIGVLTVNANGSYTFVPVANYNGLVPTVTYRVTDGQYNATATLDITVTPVNDPPVDNNETNTVTEDTTLTVADGNAGDLLNNASDIDGDTLTISGFSVAGEPGPFVVGSGYVIAGVGTITINANGSYAFVPSANYNGAIPAITYTVSDGAGGTDSSTLTLSMTAINDPPVAVDDTGTTPEDTTLNGQVLPNDSDVDGDTLSVTQFVVDGTTYTAGDTATIPGVGTLTINADGSYAFMPSANYNGPVPTATYTLSDSNGGTDTGALDISVTPVNDPPVAVDDTGTTPEDTTLNGDVLTNDTDVEGDTLTVTQFVVEGTTYTAGDTATISGVGTLTINANGSYTFVPSANYDGPVPTATYTISDSDGGTDSGALDITITPVNDPPVDGSETNTVIEDTALTVANGSTGDLLNNASDLDGDTLTISSFVVAGETGPFVVGTGYVITGVGTITINANGSYTFQPAANYNGAIPVITYTVSDGAGGTDSSTLTLTMTAVNDPPVAVDDTSTTFEDTTLNGNVLPNDSDVDGDTLTVTQFVVDGTTYTAGDTATIAGVGALTINADGSYIFVPSANYNGPVPTATYTLSDGNGGTDTGALDITVTPVDDPPVAVDDTGTTPEDTTLNGNVLTNDTDVDGDTLTVTQFVVAGTTYAAGDTAIISGVGTLTINADGSYAFVPSANYNGPVPTATYTLSDSNGGSDTGALDITVTPVNDPPVAVDDTGTTAEDTTLNGNVLPNDTDVDADTLSVTQFVVDGTTYAAGDTATIAGVGTLTINADGSYTFVPSANYNGPVPTATYTVSDGNGGTDAGALDLTVTPVNDPPVAVDDSATTPEDTTLNGNVLPNDTDVDGDTLSVTQFVVDGTSYSAGDAATIPGVGQLTINVDGSYTFVPVANYNGPVPTATYTVSDSNGGTDTGALDISVTPINDPPIAVDDTGTTAEDTMLNGNVLPNDTDVDGDTLSVTEFVVNGVTYAAGDTATIAGVGQLTINVDGSYTFVPAADYNGPVPTATYTVSDGSGGTDTGDLDISVTPINDPPGERDIPDQTDVDSATVTPVDVSDYFFDVDGDVLTYSISGLPAGLSMDSVTGLITGTLTNDTSQGSPYTVFVTAHDPSGSTTTQSFEWTVDNPAPVARLDIASGPEDTVLTGTVMGNDSDPDGDTITVTQFVVGGVTYAAGETATLDGVGTLVINADGSYTFTPALNYNGRVPLVLYTLSDSDGGTDTARLAIRITPVNDVPDLVDDQATGVEDTTITGNVLPNDSDPDGDQLTVIRFSVDGDSTIYQPGDTATIPGVGTISIGSDGAFTFIPAPNYDGPVPGIVYTATDGNGGEGQATLTITITPVDDFVPLPDDRDPNLPDSPDYEYDPANVDGAVIEAVEEVDGLNGIVDFVEDPDAPLKFVLHTFLGGSSAVVIDVPGGGDEAIRIEVIKNRGVIYLQIIDETRDGRDSSVLSFRLRPADGASEVLWARQVGPLTFAGYPDAHAGTVDFILSIVQRDGRVSEHLLRLDTLSGNLSQPPVSNDHGLQGNLAPMFSEQMRDGVRGKDMERLERALGFR